MHLCVDRSCVAKDFTKYRVMIKYIIILNNPRSNTMRSVISNNVIYYCRVDEVSISDSDGSMIMGTEPQLVRLFM